MKKKTIAIIALAVMICAAALLLNACGFGSVEIPDVSCDEAEGSCCVEVEEISAYSGPYYEDGSNDEVSGVMQIKVTNTGNEDYQLLYLRVTDKKDNEYLFKLTSLKHGETMVALEENRASYKSLKEITAICAENVVAFDATPSTHPEKFSLMGNGDTITVVNNTDSLCSNIYVYYKTYDGEIARGGITYRVSIPQLSAGESAEVSTAHYNSETCKFVFVTYE